MKISAERIAFAVVSIALTAAVWWATERWLDRRYPA